MEVSKKIGKAEWKEFFRKQFKSKKIEKGKEKMNKRRKNGNIEEIRLEEEWKDGDSVEIKKIIKKLKKKKVAGPDKIPNEAWTLGGELLEEKMVNCVRKICKGEGIPEEWRWGR